MENPKGVEKMASFESISRRSISLEQRPFDLCDISIARWTDGNGENMVVSAVHVLMAARVDETTAKLLTTGPCFSDYIFDIGVGHNVILWRHTCPFLRQLTGLGFLSINQYISFVQAVQYRQKART